MARALVEELSGLHLFEVVPKSHLRKISKLVEMREVPANEQLIREGTYTREFFIILDGAVKVSVRGRERDRMARGEFFGEIALLGHSARSATVTTTVPSRLAVIDAQDFERLIESEPKVALYMLRVLARRLEFLSTKPRGKLL